MNIMNSGRSLIPYEYNNSRNRRLLFEFKTIIIRRQIFLFYSIQDRVSSASYKSDVWSRPKT